MWARAVLEQAGGPGLDAARPGPDRPLPEVAVPESDRPTSDNPFSPDQQGADPASYLQDLLDPTVPPASEQGPSEPMPPLEHDRQVLAWLQCSPELGAEVTGYICDALLDWSLNGGRPYPDMVLPDAGLRCDHLQALREIGTYWSSGVARYGE